MLIFVNDQILKIYSSHLVTLFVSNDVKNHKPFDKISQADINGTSGSTVKISSDLASHMTTVPYDLE